jgi:transglutaminase-like putative cysteine protease
MNTPPFLIGSALLFWGWQTGHYLSGTALAVFLEGARYSQWRWELAESDYHRVWDLCSLLFFGLLLYLGTSQQLTASGYVFVQWLPVIFAPIMAAQWLGAQNRISYQTFSWFLRRKKSLGQTSRALNISYLYFALCLYATSGANRPTLWFYAGFCLLMGWVLWAARPRRFSPLVWLIMLAAVVAAGYQTQRILHELQGMVEGQIGGWLSGLARKSPDANESRTAIGHLGRIKLSGRIVLRLETNGRQSPPQLLRESSYNVFKQAVWYGASRNYTSILPDTNEVWQLLPEKQTSNSLRIAGYLKRGKGVLALPAGTAQISELPVGEMEHNRLGVVRVVNGPGFFNFRAHYGPGPALDSPPDTDDLRPAEQEDAAISRVAAELKLTGKSDKETLNAVKSFFLDNFRYTTYLQVAPRSPAETNSLLADFLLKQRAGHCEYFATATVLLLRKAGIPARYATGYAVEESASRTKFVVRERHAHAWSLAWLDGAWQDFDTTPAAWDAIEAQHASLFQPLTDLGSWLWFHFSQWRYGSAGFRKAALWLMVPLGLVLVWRIFTHKSRTRTRPKTPQLDVVRALAGADSEFYLIEQRLAKLGFSRDPSQSLSCWLKSLESAPGTVPLPSLNHILSLHYRYRFDPQGLAAPERDMLKSAALTWLQQSSSLAQSMI